MIVSHSKPEEELLRGNEMLLLIDWQVDDLLAQDRVVAKVAGGRGSLICIATAALRCQGLDRDRLLAKNEVTNGWALA